MDDRSDGRPRETAPDEEESTATSVGVGDVVRLPFDTVRYAYRQFRRTFFTDERPAGEYHVVDAQVHEVQRVLGRRSFAPNWEFSYHYRGEVLNLARIEYELREVEGVPYEWWQTHVRAWEGPDGVELQAHWELEPTEHASGHLAGVGCVVERGMEFLDEVLDDAGVEYETLTIAPEELVDDDRARGPPQPAG